MKWYKYFVVTFFTLLMLLNIVEHINAMSTIKSWWSGNTQTPVIDKANEAAQIESEFTEIEGNDPRIQIEKVIKLLPRELSADLAFELKLLDLTKNRLEQKINARLAKKQDPSYVPIFKAYFDTFCAIQAARVQILSARYLLQALANAQHDSQAEDYLVSQMALAGIDPELYKLSAERSFVKKYDQFDQAREQLSRIDPLFLTETQGEVYEKIPKYRSRLVEDTEN